MKLCGELKYKDILYDNNFFDIYKINKYFFYVYVVLYRYKLLGNLLEICSNHVKMLVL